uniref:Uncharacterized protein n=1 Tax=Timema poppense TaxID=170557 RepID=A0A7R9DFU7_TIMPO|nr:unnamed protein product [Timema poppensis]
MSGKGVKCGEGDHEEKKVVRRRESNSQSEKRKGVMEGKENQAYQPDGELHDSQGNFAKSDNPLFNSCEPHGVTNWSVRVGTCSRAPLQGALGHAFCSRFSVFLLGMGVQGVVLPPLRVPGF